MKQTAGGLAAANAVKSNEKVKYCHLLPYNIITNITGLAGQSLQLHETWEEFIPLSYGYSLKEGNLVFQLMFTFNFQVSLLFHFTY